MEFARRLADIPPYLFAELNQKKARMIAEGSDVIDLSIGDPVPELPTPDHIVEVLREAALRPEHQNYPDYNGCPEFRQAVAGYYQRRFNVELDWASEVTALNGAKEGLAHLIWAVIDRGDVALVPDPGYPVYATQVRLAGGAPHFMPLTAANGFKPDLDQIPVKVAEVAKLMIINYPNNPTGAVVEDAYIQGVVDFCLRHDIILCYDNAYAETTFDGYVAPSVLEFDGAMEIAVETYSLSKPFNMTGWRIGAAVGNRNIIAALRRIKTNVDTGVFTPVQLAAVHALKSSPETVFSRSNSVYERRRDAALAGFSSLGWELPVTKGSFYIWLPVPEGHDGGSFAQLLLEELAVVVAPGATWGSNGMNYVRVALTVEEERIREAIQRMKDAGIRGFISAGAAAGISPV